MRSTRDPVTSWRHTIEWITQSLEHRELDGINGEPVVFEWTFFQDTQHCSYFRNSKVQSEKFKDRIIFLSLYNDIDLGGVGINDICLSNSLDVAAYVIRFPKDIGHSSDQEQKKKCTEGTPTNQTVCGTMLLI